MPPPIILDSDDEDAGYSPSYSPRTALLHSQPPMAIRSPVRVSRETISTDSSFFQTIYDEQNNAAREKAHMPQTRSPERSRKSKEQVNGQNSGEWTQQSTPGREKAPMAIMDDPWDVPSSPEMGQPLLTSRNPPKRRESRSLSGRVSEQRSPRNTRHEQREKNRPTDGSSNSRGSPSKQRKRRKIEQSEASQQADNDVDLVTIPFSHEAEPGPTPSMLPPTLPINHDVSFYIASKPFMDTQKIEYQSLHLPSSDGNNNAGDHNQMLPVMQNDFRVIGSSGSATNLNTQRSDGFGLSTAPLPSDTTDADRQANGLSAPRPWGSSPDIIAVDDWSAKSKETRLRVKPVHDAPFKNIATKEVAEIIDEPKEFELPPLDVPRTDDTNAEDAEQPVKQKRTRGRSKKKPGVESTQPVQTEEPAYRDVEPVKTQKKKRGRPRKPEQVPTTPDEVKASDEKVLDESEILSVLDKPSSAKEGPEADVSTENSDESVRTGNKHTTEDYASLVEAKIDVTITKTGTKTDTAALQAEEEDEKDIPTVAIKSATPTRGLSALLSKPMYRVGLSKRSRIAPLLKSLRKE